MDLVVAYIANLAIIERVMHMKKERSTAFNPRQYMLSRDFEIYYYSDLHFQSVGRHSHDYYEFYFFVEGAVSMELGDRCYPLLQGDVIVVPPGVQHRALLSDPTVPYRRFVFWISRDYVDALHKQSSDYTYLTRRAEAANGRLWHFDVLTFNTLRGELFALLDELHADRFGKQTQINLNICNLLLRLNRLAHEQTHRPTKKESVSTYEAITAFIDTHLEEPLSLDRIAQEFYLSKYYISHLFQQSVGLSVHRYLSKKRLAACAAAIRSGAKVTEVCRTYGFGDYTGFYRAFRKEYGMSPSDYREIGASAETESK